MSVGPHYNLTGKELFCFSDEEGGNPFRFPSEEVSTGDDLGIPALLQEKFTLVEGMITGIQDPNVALGFLGDLVDNEAYSIRVLQNIIKVKKENLDRVILIGGNRDFNKLRMGIELYIQEASGYLPWYNVSDIKGLIERLKTKQFVFRKKDVPEYLKGVLKPWTDSMGELEKVYTSGTIKQRVEVMFGRTLGAVLQTLKNEIKILIGYPNFADDAVFAKLICTLQMVMSFKWEGLPTFLEPFNGLYIDYLSLCHVVASFEINGKLGVMSHGGLPHTFIEKGVKVEHRLTSPFGFKHEEAKTPDNLSTILTNNLTTILKEIEEEKMSLVNAINSYRDKNFITINDKEIDEKKIDKNLADAYDLINKYVHLTAGTNLTDGASSQASPIVGLQSIDVENRRGDIEVQFTGGAATGWIGRQKEKGIKRVADGSDLISYDIFGHAPQGFLPTAYRENKTLYVNLDISKADGQANNLSFTFLHINPNGPDEFIGRIKFTDKATQKPKTTYNGTEDLNTKIHYFKEVIPSAPVKLLKGRFIPNLDNDTYSIVEKDYSRKIGKKSRNANAAAAAKAAANAAATAPATAPATTSGGRRKSRHGKKSHKKGRKGKRKTHRRRIA